MGAATPAFAADDDLVVSYHPENQTVTRSLKVDLTGFSRTTAEGRSAIMRKVTVAAKHVCDYNGGLGLRQGEDYDRCFDKARGDAMSEAQLVQTASR
jgi:UrcA family protein